MISMSHPLSRLVESMLWGAIAERLGSVLPSVPLRLMVGLLYLKHALNASDEQVVLRWAENPYRQYFCGDVYYQAELPCDTSSLTRWRDRLGETGVEELLARTIEAAKAMKAISVHELRRVVVDSMVQEKAVAYPTDSRLLEVVREQLLEVARAQVSALRQSYRRTGPPLSRQAGRYAHAKPYKRMCRVLGSSHDCRPLAAGHRAQG